MDNKVLGVTPLKDGLFKVGNDIVCSYPLLSTVIDLDNCQITYVYEPYEVIVSWTEETPGTRTNPHWERVYPD